MFLIRLFVVVFLFSLASYADISGETVVVVNNVQRSVAGSRVQGGWTEAFIDFAQFAAGMYSFLNGSPYAGYQAYLEFRQFLDASSDKAALSHGNVALTQGLHSDAQLRFTVQSDDDPFGVLNVAYPNGANLGSAFTKKVTWNGQKNATINLTVNPNQLLVGTYPVVFYTKERDCNMCLSITHKINVRVLPAPKTCLPTFPRPCVLANDALLRTENTIENTQQQKRSLIQALYQYGPHEALKQLKYRLNVCRHTANPGDCIERAYQEFEGYCSKHAFGIRTQNATCGQIMQMDKQLEQLEKTREEQVKTRTNSCVCQNSGGPGRPHN